MWKRLSVALSLSLILAASAPAQPRSGGAPLLGAAVVFDPTNFEQNLATAIQTAEAIRQRIEMIRNQIQQIEWMVQNLRDLEHPRFREVASLLEDLERRMRLETEGLVYSLRDLSERFQKLYPDARASDDLRRDDLLRATTTLETLRAALLSTQQMALNTQPSQHTLAEMKRQALATDGQLEVLQSQTLLTSWVGEEVSKLLQQVAVQTNLQAVYFAHRLSSDLTAEETFRRAVAESHLQAPAYDAIAPISVVPRNYPRGFLGGN